MNTQTVMRGKEEGMPRLVASNGNERSADGDEVH